MQPPLIQSSIKLPAHAGPTSREADYIMTSARNELENWQKRLQSDMELILAEEIGPPALQRRLSEALTGVDGAGRWPRFRALGGGTSHQSVDNGKRVIAVEFTNASEARAVHEKLSSIMPKFQVITELDIADATHRRKSFVTLNFPEPAR